MTLPRWGRKVLLLAIIPVPHPKIKKRSKKDQLCHVNKQHAIFMKMFAAITEKCIFSYSSVNITDNGTIRVSTSMF